MPQAGIFHVWQIVALRLRLTFTQGLAIAPENLRRMASCRLAATFDIPIDLGNCAAGIFPDRQVAASQLRLTFPYGLAIAPENLRHLAKFAALRLHLTISQAWQIAPGNLRCRANYPLAAVFDISAGFDNCTA